MKTLEYGKKDTCRDMVKWVLKATGTDKMRAVLHLVQITDTGRMQAVDGMRAHCADGLADAADAGLYRVAQNNSIVLLVPADDQAQCYPNIAQVVPKREDCKEVKWTGFGGDWNAGACKVMFALRDAFGIGFALDKLEDAVLCPNSYDAVYGTDGTGPALFYGCAGSDETEDKREHFSVVMPVRIE